MAATSMPIPITIRPNSVDNDPFSWEPIGGDVAGLQFLDRFFQAANL